MISIFLYLFASGISHSASRADSDVCRLKNSSWYNCAKNSDCTIVANPCGYPIEAALQKYKEKAETCYRHLGAAMSCATWKEVGGISWVPQCLHQQCVAIKK